MTQLILALLTSLSAFAEYRAFELVIKNKTTGEERVVISILDPYQYRIWHPVSSDSDISYRTTWRCRGNTSNFQPVCPKPEKN